MMNTLPQDFLVGAATAAHQVEGNNIHSDYWAMEHMKYGNFNEPSLDAVDHYNRYEEDIKMVAEAGLNAYRFSIEWARIEPKQGVYDENEIEHYRKVLTCCRENGVEPIVTMMHFTSPKWLIENGGWENEATVEAFKNYCQYVTEQLGDLMHYVCTINEANMGIQVAAISARYRAQMMAKMQRMQQGGAEEKKDLEGTAQVGMNFNDMMANMQKQKEENVEIKSLKESKKVLILSASPRRKGNSQILCDKFAEGAKSAGHQVKMIRLSDKKINFCKACDACMKNEGLCIQRDDMGDILKAYQQADILVLATPVYFYGISAQMKTFIDRTYPIWQNLGHKNVYYIISAGLGEDIINRSLGDLDGFVEHLDDSKVKGRIYATNVMDAGLVKEQEDLLERAYEMGKSIFNVSANL